MVRDSDPRGPRQFRISGWLVEADLNRISRDGGSVSVEPRVMEVLCYLAARRGAVVSRDELLQTVWGGRPVTDHVLTRAIGQLRHALHDDPHAPRVIETIAKSGYRLLVPVNATADEGNPAALGFWPRLRAIAVLPFQLLSVIDAHGPISEGMIEILVSEISRIEGLYVIARASAFSSALDGLSLEDIGTRLGVDAIVQGSVHGEDDRLRVDMRLVRTRDGRVLWSGTVRGSKTDLLTLHEQAAQKITAALRGTSLPARGPTATANTGAYREYLFGRHHWNRRTADGFEKAIVHFEAAIERDPRYAQAHAALAQTYALLPYYCILSPHEAMPRARRAAERALELESHLAQAHTVFAQILHEYEWKAEQAEAEFKLAIDLDPNDSTAHQWFAEFLLVRERVEESLPHIEKALNLEPLSAIVSLLPAGPFLWEGRYQQAQAVIQRTLQMQPQFGQARNLLALSQLWGGNPERAIAPFEEALSDLGVSFVGPQLGCAYAMVGRRKEARRLLEKVLAEAETHYISPSSIAGLHVGFGNSETALAWLEKAYDERDGGLRYLNVDRRFDPLREDTRFIALHRRVGLPAPNPHLQASFVPDG